MRDADQSNSSGRPPYRRKLINLVVNPGYQFRYVFWVSLTGAFLVVLNAGIFYSYVKENYAILVDLSPMTDEAKALLYQELHQILLELGLASFAFILLVSFLGLVFSHRTAGPMYHFDRVFREIKEGKVDSRVRLRPKDDFRNVADTFNEMMDSLRSSSTKQ